MPLVTGGLLGHSIVTGGLGETSTPIGPPLVLTTELVTVILSVDQPFSEFATVLTSPAPAALQPTSLSGAINGAALNRLRLNSGAGTPPAPATPLMLNTGLVTILLAPDVDGDPFGVDPTMTRLVT